MKTNQEICCLHRPARRCIVPSRAAPGPKNMVLDAEAEEPPAFASLTAYLLCIVAKKLDAQSLASFAAACSACRAVAHEPLGEALLQVLKRCLSGVRIQPWSPDRPHFTSAWETETFKGCGKNLKLLLLGNLTGVTSVGDNAFRDCSSLSKCVLPSGLVTIGTSAFERCTSLTELTLPATLTSIGDDAFAGCSALVELTLPTALTSIGTRAFSDCTSLTTLIVPAASQLTHVGDEAQGHLDAPTETRLLTPCTPVAGEFAFERCTSLAKLVVHYGLLPKDLREARTRTTIDLLHRLLKKSGVKPVPKAAKLAWPVPDTLASIEASQVDPQLAEQLPNQPRRLHYCYRRVRLLLHQVCKSELEIWISELEI